MIESRTCLLPMITPQTQFLLRQFQHYKNQLLPYAGGILEQPAYYAEAMEILAARDAQIRAEILDKQRRDAARQPGARHG